MIKDWLNFLTNTINVTLLLDRNEGIEIKNISWDWENPNVMIITLWQGIDVLEKICKKEKKYIKTVNAGYYELVYKNLIFEEFDFYYRKERY